MVSRIGARRARVFAALVLVPALLLVGLATVPIAETLVGQAPSGDASSIVVVVPAGADLASLDAQARAAGFVRTGAILQIGVLQYREPAAAKDRGVSAAAAWRSSAAAAPALAGASVAPTTTVSTFAYPVPTNDPLFGSQWGFPLMHEAAAWPTSTGAGITVGVVDTGIDITNKDLSGAAVSAGWNVLTGSAGAVDGAGHGSHVSGMIAATANNSWGIAGAAPDARILAVKALTDAGSGTSTQIAAGVTYAADHGVRVINLSLGGSSPMPDLQAAIDYAIARGVVVVAAAGNSGNGTAVSYPCAYAEVICVGATDQAGNLATYSSTGPPVDLVAVGIAYSTVPLSLSSSGIALMQGTSMATPYVSAAATLVLSRNPSLTAAQVQSILQTSARHPSGGRNDQVGYGLLDVTAALAATSAPTASPSATPGPSATASPAPSGTARPSGTASPSPSATPAPTAMPSPSLTASPSPAPPSATATPQPSAVPSPTPTLVPTPTPSASPIATPKPAATPAPSTVRRSTTFKTTARGGISITVTPSKAAPQTVLLTGPTETLLSRAVTGGISITGTVSAGTYTLTVTFPAGVVETVTWSGRGTSGRTSLS